MPSLASGKMSCTAWASTCAVEWRSTLSPSGESIGDRLDLGVGRRAPSPGRAAGPSASRTTTIAFGPVVGRPAAATASARRRPGRDDDGVDHGPGT